MVQSVLGKWHTQDDNTVSHFSDGMAFSLIILWMESKMRVSTGALPLLHTAPT